MKKIGFILCCALTVGTLHAQKISMDFPYFAGKTYEFIIFQGDKAEKLVQGSVPANGKFSIRIPEEYTPYRGMGRWMITSAKEGGGLDMVILGNDFSVSCYQAQPKESNISYTGNSAMYELNTLRRQQETILMKYAVMQQAMKTFAKTDKNYPVFEQERKTQETAFAQLQAELKQPATYAKQIVSIINLTRGIGTALYEDEEKRARDVAGYMANEMNWQTLYTSGLWTAVIGNWVNIHTLVLQDNYAFVNDFVKITSRIQDKKLYKDFANRVAYFLTQQGKDEMISALAPYVIASERIDDYNGSLAAYKAGTVGTQAPDLVFTERTGTAEPHSITLKSTELAGEHFKQTLVIFYESGCGPCENVLQQLPGNFADIQQKKTRVISVSSDKEETTFRSKAKDFPWQEAYCDYEGLKGINFKNYGIAGTPTLVLIDGDGKIILKTASLGEVLNKLK